MLRKKPGQTTTTTTTTTTYAAGAGAVPAPGQQVVYSTQPGAVVGGAPPPQAAAAAAAAAPGGAVTVVERTEYAYVPAVCQTPVPTPRPPCTDVPLPWEEDERKRQELLAKQREKARAHEQAQSHRKQKASFFSKVTSVASDVAHGVEREAKGLALSATDTYHAKTEKWAGDRFRVRVVNCLKGQVPRDEKLLGEYEASCVSAGQSLVGAAYVTERLLCFWGEFSDHKTQPGKVLKHPVRMALPLASICSLQKGASAPATNKLAAPIITLVPQGATTTTDSVLAYTQDGRLHLLYAVKEYVEFFRVLDYAWRGQLPNGTPPLAAMAAGGAAPVAAAYPQMSVGGGAVTPDASAPPPAYPQMSVGDAAPPPTSPEAAVAPASAVPAAAASQAYAYPQAYPAAQAPGGGAPNLYPDLS